MTLPEKLRSWEGEYHYPSGLLVEAADHIERLESALRAICRAEETSTIASAVAIAQEALRVATE